jgi:hypothetical protein
MAIALNGVQIGNEAVDLTSFELELGPVLRAPHPQRQVSAGKRTGTGLDPLHSDFDWLSRPATVVRRMTGRREGSFIIPQV